MIICQAAVFYNVLSRTVNAMLAVLLVLAGNQGHLVSKVILSRKSHGGTRSLMVSDYLATEGLEKLKCKAV
jgi:hypothetical protein